MMNKTIANFIKLARQRSRNFFILNRVTLLLLILINISLFDWSWWTIGKIILFACIYQVFTVWLYNNVFIQRYGISLMSLMEAMESERFIVPSAINYILKGNFSGEIELDVTNETQLFNWLTKAKLVKVVTPEKFLEGYDIKITRKDTKEDTKDEL